jgi:hypothetical protein
MPNIFGYGFGENDCQSVLVQTVDKAYYLQLVNEIKLYGFVFSNTVEDENGINMYYKLKSNSNVIVDVVKYSDENSINYQILIDRCVQQEANYSNDSGNYASNSYSANNSSKSVFICSNQDGCCLAVVNSNSRPSEGMCNSRRHLPAGQNGHSWREVGKQGDKSYMCNRCSVVVNTASYPSSGGCCPEGGCSSGHSWSEVR